MPMGTIRYQVGDLIYFQDSDPEFDEWQAAYVYALQLAEESDEHLLGIWTSQEDGGELMAIVHQGDVFTK